MKPIYAPMHGSLATVHESEELATAYHALRNSKSRHLLVLNDEGQIIGVLTQRDMHRASLAQNPNARPTDLMFTPDQKVKTYMSFPVRLIPKDTELKVVCKGMIDSGVSAYLVIDHGQIFAAVTTEDLLRALYRILFDPDKASKARLENLFFTSSIGHFADNVDEFEK